MEENRNNNNQESGEGRNIFEDIFEKKSEPKEKEEDVLWEESDGSQSKLFKNTAIGSFIAGILIGGILIFLFGKYM